MSRSARRLGPAKSGKAWGFEFWSARPGNRCGGSIGKIAKRFTHKTERAQGRAIVREDLSNIAIVVKHKQYVEWW